MALLGPDQGLPSGAIITITQDKDGFIWLGTENGIIMYEGNHHQRWTTDDGLPSSYIHRVLSDPQGGIWIGTLKGLLHFHEGRFEKIRLGTAAPGSISSICYDKQGLLWAVQSHRVFRQVNGLSFKEIPVNLEDGPVTVFSGSRTGMAYISSSKGIMAFDGEHLIRSWSRRHGLPQSVETMVVEDGRGCLWAGSGRFLVMKEPESEQFVDYSHLLPATLSPNSVPYTDHDGSIWFPTQNGALHLTANGSDVLDYSCGLPFKWVRTVFRDLEGTLWVLGPALAKLMGKGKLWNYSLASGAYGEVVWRVKMDPRFDTPLLGTDDGAARMTSTGLEIIPGTQGIRIKDLLVDRANTLWMVSSIGPTLWMHEGDRTAVTAPFGDLGKGINTVMEDSRGKIWLGHSRQGLLLWKSEEKQLQQVIGPNQGDAQALGVFGLREDKTGRIWAGTTSGLFIGHTNRTWNRYTLQNGLRSDTVRGITLMDDGSAWIYYQEPMGLTHIRIDNDNLTVFDEYTRENGLISNAVFAAEPDSQQRLWITTDQGFSRMSPPLHVGREEGMVSEDCAIGALLIDGNRVWVGTASGLVRFDSDDRAPPPDIPTTHIMSIQYGKQLLNVPFPKPKPLPAQEAHILFRIAIPSFVNENAVHYRIRLLGLEKDWRNTVSKFIRYPSLPAGSYRFEVQGALSHGPFGPVTHFEFSVKPFWWRTWWAHSLFGMLILILIFWLIRFRVSSLARSKAELEALIYKRTQELSKRNVELSNALLNIKQLSGLLPICAHCKKIRDDQGYWNQLETYISAHTDADFSHGICPSCAKTLYPNFYNRDNESQTDIKNDSLEETT